MPHCVAEVRRLVAEPGEERFVDGLDDIHRLLGNGNAGSSDRYDSGAGVTLITLHASKGLEFPHVYLLGCEEGLLPHDRSKVEGTVDEERRLLYVGITRAKKTLSLAWCRSRVKYGSAMPCMASSFLKELDPGLVEHCDVGEILGKPVAEEKAAAKFGAIFEMLDKL